jgi:hypothetical protein
MKQVIFLHMYLLSCVAMAVEVQEMKLEQALRQKQIVFQASGQPTDGHSHYGTCIRVNMKNLTSQSIRVTLENGRLLVPADSQVQNMLITQNTHFDLAPYASVSHLVQAMCAQRFDASPTRNSSFSHGYMAGEKLRSISAFIEQHKLYNSAGQAAVWCVSDRKPVWEINLPDTHMQRQVRSFVASLTGLPMKPMPSISQLHGVYPEATADASVYKTTCTFEYTLHRAMPVTIQVYNHQNTLVKTLREETAKQPGKTSARVQLSTRELPAGVYRVVLSLGNEQTITQQVVLGRVLLEAQREE